MFNISERKSEHLKICIKDNVQFESKTNGLENYDFPHYASSEVKISEIDTSFLFFDKKINFPFLISCMTGGTREAERINEKLSLVASELNIPIGVGSQRQAIEDTSFINSYKTIKNNSGNAPVLGNIGAAQVAKLKNPDNQILKLIDILKADAFVIHLNPLQELFQKEGEPDFYGLKKNVEKICKKISTPIIIKEVGAGISDKVAKEFLDIGVKGIDVAGAGGTSWAKVEMIRNGNIDEFFSEWGLPTSYCLRKIKKLKKKYEFLLISSGGINHYSDIAKSLALGADMTASARLVLKQLLENDSIYLIDYLKDVFNNVKKIMYLTGCKNLEEFHKIKLIKKEKLY